MIVRSSHQPTISAVSQLLTILAFVAMLGAPTTTIAADGFTDAEKAGLSERVTEMNAAAASGDPAAAVDQTTPEVMAHVAKERGITVDEVRQQAIDAFSTVLDQTKTYEIFIDMASAAYVATPSGTPYALIPQKTTVILETGQGVEMSTQVIAFLHNGEWRLTAVVDQSTLTMMETIYPQMKGLKIPPVETKAVTDGG